MDQWTARQLGNVDKWIPSFIAVATGSVGAPLEIELGGAIGAERVDKAVVVGAGVGAEPFGLLGAIVLHPSWVSVLFLV